VNLAYAALARYGASTVSTVISSQDALRSHLMRALSRRAQRRSRTSRNPLYTLDAERYKDFVNASETLAK